VPAQERLVGGRVAGALEVEHRRPQTIRRRVAQRRRRVQRGEPSDASAASARKRAAKGRSPGAITADSTVSYTTVASSSSRSAGSSASSRRVTNSSSNASEPVRSASATAIGQPSVRRSSAATPASSSVTPSAVASTRMRAVEAQRARVDERATPGRDRLGKAEIERGAREHDQAHGMRHAAREHRDECGELRSQDVRIVDHDPERCVDVSELLGERRSEPARLAALRGKREREPAGVGPRRPDARDQGAGVRVALPGLRVVPRDVRLAVERGAHRCRLPVPGRGLHDDEGSVAQRLGENGGNRG
jgi:hypothetical protein